MSREIKFKGKDIDQNKWIYGSYVKMAENDGTILEYVEEIDGQVWIVFPETVGQYTGLKDKNGKEIYEGDIVQIPLNIREYFNCEVKFNDGCFDVVQGDFRDYLKVYIANRCIKVIGNIYENSELLEVENE